MQRPHNSQEQLDYLLQQFNYSKDKNIDNNICHSIDRNNNEQNRYNGFLSALNINYQQSGGSVKTCLLTNKKSTDSLNYTDMNRIADYSFDSLKYQHHNPILGANQLGADIDFRQRIMKSTR